MSDAANEGTWTWTSGEPVTYTNWLQGEPSDTSGLENYVHMNFNFPTPAAVTDTVGRWNDNFTDLAPRSGSAQGLIELNTAPQIATDWVRAAQFKETCTPVELAASGTVSAATKVATYCDTTFSGTRTVQFSGAGSALDAALGAAPRLLDGSCNATISARAIYQKSGSGSASWGVLLAAGDTRGGYDPVVLQFSTGGLANEVAFTDTISPLPIGGLNIQLGNSSGTLPSNTATISIGAGGYSHIALVTTGNGINSQTSSLFINGVLKSSATIASAACVRYDTDMKSYIGSVHGSQFWVGKISFVRAFNRALSLAEIAQDTINLP